MPPTLTLTFAALRLAMEGYAPIMAGKSSRKAPSGAFLFARKYAPLGGMKKLPTTRPSNPDLDAILRDRMEEIEALVNAIENDEPDCDLKLAELLEGEVEAVRIAIIKKLREMLRARAEEKEKELNKLLEKEQRIKVERQRGMFLQWLQWMMSEETIRKMREAFLANSMLERVTRNIGRDMAARGMNDVQLGDKRELGGLSNNVPQALGKGKEKDESKGRS